jgi:hypothetical protein
LRVPSINGYKLSKDIVRLAYAAPMPVCMAYTVDGVTQSKPITRMVYASPTSVCR